jgi:hypothetical protein
VTQVTQMTPDSYRARILYPLPFSPLLERRVIGCHRDIALIKMTPMTRDFENRPLIILLTRMTPDFEKSA